MERFKKRKISRFSAVRNSTDAQNDRDIDYMSTSFGCDSLTTQSNKAYPEETKAFKKGTTTLMEEKLEEGLQSTIGEENIGYHLMQKFGYDSGGLGLSGQGICEPIKIVKRSINSKIGLGRESIQHAKKLEYNKKLQTIRQDCVQKELEKAEMIEKLQKQFIEGTRVSSKVKEMQVAASQAERVIYELDLKAGVSCHDLWPENYISSELESNRAIETSMEEAKEKLKSRVMYLRECYSYCMFCGCTFEGEEDLNTECPGLWPEDH
eukprot:gene584-1131_t